MAGSIVEKLVITADATGFDSGLRNAEKRLASFGSSIAKVGLSITAVGVAAMAALGVSIKNAIDQADELGKMAQKIGVPIEELSKLKYAADLSDVSLEQLGAGVGKLSKNMETFARTGSGEAENAFRSLGISVKNSDGTMRAAGDVIVDVAGRFERMDDGATKTAYAMQLFGKAGANMIPLLNTGAQGLRDLYREAEKLGLVINEKTRVAAEAFNDNLTTMGRIKDGIVLKIAAELVPGLQFLSGVLVSTSKNADLMSSAGRAVNEMITNGVTNVMYLVTGYERLTLTWKALKDVWNTKDLDDLAVAWSALKLVVEGNEKAFANVPERARALIAELQKLGDAAKKMAKDTTTVELDPLTKQIENLKIKTAEAEGKFYDFAPGFAQAAIGLNLFTAKTLLASNGVIVLTDDAKDLNNEMWRSQAVGLKLEMLTPYEQFGKTLDELTVKVNNERIGQEEYSRAVQRAAEMASLSWETAAGNMSSAMQNAGKVFGDESGILVGIAQAMGIVQATIAAWTGASQALTLPFPYNIAAFAAVLAKGLGAVAQIKAMKVPSYAQGGSFMVPGGVSGVDNRLTTLNLAAGERVDVTPASQVGRNSNPVTIDVSGLGRRNYSRDDVAAIIEGINAALGDGYRLRPV